MYNQFAQMNLEPEDDRPALIRLVMRCSGGLIQNEQQATYALLAIAAIGLLMSGYVFLFVGNEKPEIPDDLDMHLEMRR